MQQLTTEYKKRFGEDGLDYSLEQFIADERKKEHEREKELLLAQKKEKEEAEAQKQAFLQYYGPTFGPLAMLVFNSSNKRHEGDLS